MTNECKCRPRKPTKSLNIPIGQHDQEITLISQHPSILTQARRRKRILKKTSILTSISPALDTSRGYQHDFGHQKREEATLPQSLTLHQPESQIELQTVHYSIQFKTPQPCLIRMRKKRGEDLHQSAYQWSNQWCYQHYPPFQACLQKWQQLCKSCSNKCRCKLKPNRMPNNWPSNNSRQTKEQ